MMGLYDGNVGLNEAGRNERTPTMAEVEIYTTPLCPYCWRAKRLLDRKGVAFVEIDLWQQPQRRAEMIERADGRRTVPQLFVGGRAIGGSDELAELERSGELDALLGAG